MAFYNNGFIPGLQANVLLAQIDEQYSPDSENAQSGKAVAEAISDISGNLSAWKKIVDITTTQEVNGIVATAEEFPDLAKCKEFLVRVIYQKHGGTANLQLGSSRIECNTTICYHAGTTNVSYAAVCEQKVHIQIVDGLLHTIGTDGAVGQSALKGTVSILVGNRFVTEDIYQLKYYLGNNTSLIPTGTQFVIYGKVAGNEDI